MTQPQSVFDVSNTLDPTPDDGAVLITLCCKASDAAKSISVQVGGWKWHITIYLRPSLPGLQLC